MQADDRACGMTKEASLKRSAKSKLSFTLQLNFIPTTNENESLTELNRFLKGMELHLNYTLVSDFFSSFCRLTLAIFNQLELRQRLKS